MGEYFQEFMKNDIRYQRNSVRHYGVLIYTAKHVESFLEAREGVPAKWARTLDFPYKIWQPSPPTATARSASLTLLTEKLQEGEVVFLPLFSDGDEVSLRMPDGIYFLEFVGVMNHQVVVGSRRLGKWHPYGRKIIEVSSAMGTTVVHKPYAYMGGMGEGGAETSIGHREAMDDFESKGAMHMIAAYKQKLEEAQRQQDVRSESSGQAEQNNVPAGTVVMVRCLQCDTLNDEDANFCSECGANLSKKE